MELSEFVPPNSGLSNPSLALAYIESDRRPSNQ
jgi:hypothetical protein